MEKFKFIEPELIEAGSDKLRLGLMRYAPKVDCRVLSEDTYRELKKAYDIVCESQKAKTDEKQCNLPIVSKVEEFICPCCNKMVPITKVIYECECGVKHESQINFVTAVCLLHKDAADCKHRNDNKCTFDGSCYFKQTDC